jgi:hypothetical protein
LECYPFSSRISAHHLVASAGAPGEGKQEPTGLTRAQRQLDIKERRILQLEQQLASVRVEAEELRKRLAVAEQKLIRYRVIEEEIVQAGRRVIP